MERKIFGNYLGPLPIPERPGVLLLKDIKERTGDAAADTVSSLTTVFPAIDEALGQALADVPVALVMGPKSVGDPIEPITIDCSPSGTATITGTHNVSGSECEYTLSIALADCGGANGTLTVEGFCTGDGGQLFYNLSFSGTIFGFGCSVAFNNVGLSGEVGSPSETTVTGGATGTCTEPSGSSTIDCNWVEQTLDAATLKLGCGGG